MTLTTLAQIVLLATFCGAGIIAAQWILIRVAARQFNPDATDEELDTWTEKAINEAYRYNTIDDGFMF